MSLLTAHILRWLVPCLLLAVASALIAVGVVRHQAPPPEAHFSYLVSVTRQQNTPEFQFDGYYALQAGDLFATTIANWIDTPEMIEAAFRQADLPLPTEDPRHLIRHVSATKTAPQLVQVVVRHAKPELAHQLARGLQAQMTANVEHYHEENPPLVRFSVTPTPIYIGQPTISYQLVGLASFLLTAVVALNLVVLTAPRPTSAPDEDSH